MSWLRRMRAATWRDRFFGERDRHQVIQMAVVTAIAEVFGVGADLVLIQKALHTVQKGFVERAGCADRQRQAVTDEGVTFGKGAELLAVATTHSDPVFRGDFVEPDLRRRLVRERTHQGPPQPETCAMNGVS